MKDLDFFYFLNIFLARLKWIVLSAFIFGLSAFFICKYCIKPIYSSNVTIFCGRILHAAEPQDQTQRQVISEYTGSLNIGLQLVNDYRELLKSNRIENKVLKEILPYLLGKGNKPNAAAEMAKDRNLETVDDIKKYMKDHSIPNFYYKCIINSIRQTRIISIEVQTHDPKLCQMMATAYANAFIDEVQKIMDMQNSQIIDKARIPIYPIFPKSLRNSVVAFILGGALAYLIFFLMSLLDTTIKNPDEVTNALKIPIIGTIPQDDNLLTQNYAGNYILSTGGGSKETSLSEHFRATRVNLQYSLINKKNQALVYIITSSIPAEGKSFNSANIAASMAESGKRVLLINCDLRKPTLQKIFRLHSDLGLVNYLIGEKSFDEIVQKNVMNLPLDLIFCGPVPPNPAKLLISEEFEKLIEEQKKNYDYIFLDTPPLLSTADALLLGKCADAVLLIIRAGFTHLGLVQQTVSEAKQAKVNIVGAILNRY